MKKNNKGFSLVELIVVIAIMAILAAVAVVSYSVYVERAQEAADKDYLDNIVYFAELFAIENQLPLAWVEVAPEVNGPEDITLILQNSDGTYSKYTGDVSEIYNAVGNGYVQGGLNNGKFDPNQNEPVLPPELPGDGPCTHGTSNSTQVGHQDPTCTQDGWTKYHCNESGCGHEWTEIIVTDGHNFEEYKGQNGKYTYQSCSDCGYIVIKGPDGSVIVPID